MASSCGPRGGERTGKSPVGRSNPGTKHTPLVDRHGVRTAIRTPGATASGHRPIIPAVLDFPGVGGKPGRPEEAADGLYADGGYDSDATRWLLAWLGIEPSSPGGRPLTAAGWARSA